MYDWQPQATREHRTRLREHVQYFSWLGWSLLAETAAMLVVQLLLTGALMLVAPDLLNRGAVLWVLSVVSVYGAGIPTACLLLRRVPAPAPAPGRPLGPGRFLQVYVAGLGVMYLVNFATLALTELIGWLRGAPVTNPVESMEQFPILLNLLLGCVIAPLAEELLFRRMLLERLRPYGEGFAIVASALCFGLFHGNLNQLFYAWALGLLLGWVAVKTGRLWQPILLHALINFISTGLIPLLELLGDTGALILSGFILAAIVLGVVFLVVLRREVVLAPGSMGLSRGWTWRLFFENPGVICFCLFSLGIAVLYLL